jgi:murein L,D-transpeptidase YcbB/YkuD
MTTKIRISLVLVALLLVLYVAGAQVEIRCQVAPGQRLNAQVEAALQQIIDSAHHPDLRWSDFSPYQNEVKEFYTGTGSTLGWVRESRPTSQAMTMIRLFSDSEQEGLVPEDYDASRWPARLKKLQGAAGDAELASFDAAMTVSAMRYIRALHVGRVNPKTLGRQLDVDQRKYDLGEFVHDKVISAPDPTVVVKSVEPAFPGYLRTLDALRRYREFAKEDSGKQMLVPAKSVAPGGTYVDLPRLAQLLQLVGDLPAGANIERNSTAYQGAVVEAVKSYQVRHGEIGDGHLKAELIKEMNVPMTVRVRQIELALERWRWLDHSFPQPPVVVNLPEFKLRAYGDNYQVSLYKTVIVGKAYGHESPVFESRSRDHGYPQPPPRIRTSGFPASGSCLR